MRAAVAIALITCAVILVISPFGDLPLTIQNQKAPLVHALAVTIALGPQLQPIISSQAWNTPPASAKAERIEVLVIHRC